MKALVLHSTSEPPSLEVIPTPGAELGSAVVRVLSAGVISYMGDVYSGRRPYPFPRPMIPGSAAIGRVAATGPDATKLKPGDLVFIDGLVRSRDESTDAFLPGLHDGQSAGSKELMQNVWRNWTFAEYCRTPLEALTLLDEQRLIQDLGYTISELNFMTPCLVPYSGLRDIGLEAGQTIIIAPATGQFGGAAVQVALAMGARVIAMGRNKDILGDLKNRVPYPERLFTVPITNDFQSELANLQKFGEIDAFFDISPFSAAKSSHVKSAILALRHGGRVCIMSGYKDDVALPTSAIVHRDIRIHGKWMGSRRDITDMLKLVTSGLLKFGKAGGSEVVGEYSLERYEEAWKDAAVNSSMGKVVAITP